MTGSVLLDIGIGLMFVYLSLSLIVTAATELINSFVSIRARNLRKAITQLLGSPEVAARFYDHPLIAALATRRTRLTALAPLRDASPSYVPRDVFVAVVRDILADEYPDLNTRDLAALVAALPREHPIRRSVEALADAGSTGTAAAERWFDNAMERISGDTKRFSQVVALALGAVVAVALDVGTIDLVRTLSGDADQRGRLVEQAVAAATQAPAAESCVAARRNEPTYAALPADARPLRDVEIAGECLGLATRGALAAVPGTSLGWQRDPFADPLTAGRSLLGWLLTALALSLGAPFWFDILSKAVRVRGAGIRPADPEPPRP